MYFSSPAPSSIHHLATFFYQMKKEGMASNEPGELLMPSGTSILAFHLHGRYFVDAWKYYTGELPKNYLIGQQTVSYRLKVVEDTDIFGIALHPTIAWKMTGVPSHQLTNNPMDPYALFPTSYHPFLEAIEQSESFEKRCESVIALFEFFQTHFETQKTLVDYALELIFEKKGCISTRALCKELHVSERHLQHLFRLQVGVSPLQYARITRFNAIFVEFTQTEAPRDLGFLTSFYNYYDASHFFKDFKTYCNEAPSQFHLEKFSLLKELVEKDPYLTQVQQLKLK